MNIYDVKCAVEVARCGSISVAAKHLSMAQPNLSRCIRQLEDELGIRLFKRSYKGMRLTSEGEQFISKGSRIIADYEEFEASFKSSSAFPKHFSISVPRASYISYAFTNFSKNIDLKEMEFFYKETNSWDAIENVVSNSYKLGIVRYESDYDEFYRMTYESKGLSHEKIADFNYVLIMSKDSRIASKKEIRFSDLEDLIQISHGDPYVPLKNDSGGEFDASGARMNKVIYLFERGSQFDLLRDTGKHSCGSRRSRRNFSIPTTWYKDAASTHKLCTVTY